ncbi:hypothetical protein [Blastococcus brunescens]|uniref:Uncharacterized protein n=1 Tax=Blastococcus brunescens TaxID=1564165 RepID=A0ABZ1BCV8_9ACTN|nr:hypothetical protein [Blastococcus sp. BMG 8361]WRL67345.1 hypothetical protein U6N30_04985 [Blastococcus sp. BMG 8361]
MENERLGTETEHTGVRIAHEEASPVRQVLRRVLIAAIVLVVVVLVVYIDRDGYEDSKGGEISCSTPPTTPRSPSRRPATATSPRSPPRPGSSTSC